MPMPRLLILTLNALFLFSSFLPLAQPPEQYPVPSLSNSGLFGYADAKGNFVIKPQFEKALPFSEEGLARVRRNEGWSVINGSGKAITKKAYHEIREFRNGVAVISVRNYLEGREQISFGVINSKGNEVIPATYTYITAEPTNTSFIVGQARDITLKSDSRKKAIEAADPSIQVRFGLLNASGKPILPISYEAVRDYQFKLFALKTPEGNWQVYDAKGVQVFKGDYTDVKDFDEEYATVEKDSRWGIINRNGQIIKPLAFQEIVRKGKSTYRLLPMPQWKVVNQKNEMRFAYEFEDLKAVNAVLYEYQLKGKKGLMNEKGAYLTPPTYDQISPIAGNMTVVRINKKHGVIDKRGKPILPVEYDEIVIDSITTLIKTRNHEKWGVYDSKGKQVLPIRFGEVRIQPTGLIVAELDKKWGIADVKGTTLAPFTYQLIGDFEYGRAKAMNNDAMGIITKEGRWLAEPVFEAVHIVNDSLCVYYTGGKAGIINTRTRQMRLSVDDVEVMENGYMRVRNNGKYGLFNQKGREIIPIQYDAISDFSADSMITVQVADKKGLMQLRGYGPCKVVLKPNVLYQELQVMQEERVGVKINNRYGFIDKEGRLRIANRYENVLPFSEQMAGIQIKGKWGFIDKAEQLRVQPFYDEVQQFKNGVAMVRKGNLWGFTDKNGREIVKPQYDTLELLPTGRRLIVKNNRKGLINEQGRELFSPKYDHLEDLGNGFVIVGSKNKYGVYTLNNFDVVPVMYDQVVFNPLNNLYVLGVKHAWQNFTVSK